MTSQETWSWRELPTLRAVVTLCDERPRSGIDTDDVFRQIDGLDERDFERAMIALADDGFFEIHHEGGMQLGSVGKLAPKARREVGAWPTPESAFDRMIAALEAIAENTDDEDTRTRARKLLDGLTGAGRAIGISVAAAAITGQIPGA